MAFNFSKLNKPENKPEPTSAASEARAPQTADVIHSAQALDQEQTAAHVVQPTQVDNAQPIQNNAPILSDSQLYQTQIITSNLATLKAKLEAKIPDLHDNIRIIMKSLQSDPAQVTILTPEERSILFKSMSTIADIDLVLDAAKAAKKKIDLSAPENANLFE
jgi:hypothetical protein